MQQVEQRRLAGAGSPHDCNALPGIDRQIDIVQHGAAGIAGRRLAQFDQRGHGIINSQIGHLADLLDGTVVGILGRNEPSNGRTAGGSPDRHGEQRRRELLLEACAIDLLDIAAHGPLIIGKVGDSQITATCAGSICRPSGRAPRP